MDPPVYVSGFVCERVGVVVMFEERIWGKQEVSGRSFMFQVLCVREWWVL